MVPKLLFAKERDVQRFRAVLFRIVPKPLPEFPEIRRFRAVLFRMVPKHEHVSGYARLVLWVVIIHAVFPWR